MARDWLGVSVIALSLLSLPFVLPHVIEDFAEEITHRVGLSTAGGAFLLGGYLALQALGLILDRKSTRLNSSHIQKSRMPSSA